MSNQQIITTLKHIAANGFNGQTTLTFKSYRTELRFRAIAEQLGMMAYSRPNGQCSFEVR